MRNGSCRFATGARPSSGPWTLGTGIWTAMIGRLHVPTAGPEVRLRSTHRDPALRSPVARRRYARLVKTVVLGPRPAELEVLVEQRRARGLDLFDELWEGALHMAP